MKSDFKIRNRIWIEGAQGPYLGNGRINLLELISTTGSINDAAKELKMSYRKALSLLNSMNEQALEPLIVKSKGGIGGGGTEVTKAGKKMIRNFKKLNEECKIFLEKKSHRLGLI